MTRLAMLGRHTHSQGPAGRARLDRSWRAWAGSLALASAWLGLALTMACAEPASEADPWADEVVGFSPAANASFGHDQMPDIVLGPPGGTLDVVSLGCGGTIVLGFDEPIVDRPGPDFIVFENPFDQNFPEPGEVAVSADGQTWISFVCDPVQLEGCAGRTPTLALPDSDLSASDPDSSGGDAFDLAELGLASITEVRITDVSAAYWAALGLDYCGQEGSGGFDLDAVAAVE